MNVNHMMYGLRYEAWQTEFFVILGHFLHFYPTNNPKNQNFENLKKSLDIIIFHKCTKNHDYMLHCSWDMLCDRWNSNFSFWAIFCPFTSNSPKNKLFLKKKKIPGDIIIYHKPWSYATLLLRYGAWQS